MPPRSFRIPKGRREAPLSLRARLAVEHTPSTAGRGPPHITTQPLREA